MTPSATLPLGGKQSYFASTRAPRYSLLFALPLLVAYEMLAATFGGVRGGQVRNGADVILKELAAAAMGTRGPMVLMALIIGTSLYLVVRDWRRSGGVRSAFFGGMLLESSLLAIVFGLVIGTLTARLLGAMHLLMMNGAQGPIAGMSGPTRLMLSLGAGLYEELLFRVFLVGSLAAIARTLLGLGRRGAGIIAAVVGAVIFSAFHYIGRYGDPFEIQSFAFRALSGLAFSGLYLLRGFGITAWTHALYDAFLLLF
jgi:CAAX prenyl protease-like protein